MTQLKAIALLRSLFSSTKRKSQWGVWDGFPVQIHSHKMRYDGATTFSSIFSIILRPFDVWNLWDWGKKGRSLAIVFVVFLLLQIKPKIDMFPYVSNHPAMFNFWWTLHSKHVKVHDPLVKFIYTSFASQASKIGTQYIQGISFQPSLFVYRPVCIFFSSLLMGIATSPVTCCERSFRFHSTTVPARRFAMDSFASRHETGFFRYLAALRRCRNRISPQRERWFF